MQVPILQSHIPSWLAASLVSSGACLPMAFSRSFSLKLRISNSLRAEKFYGEGMFLVMKRDRRVPHLLVLTQERIMGEPFGAEGEYFTYSLFLVLANRVLTFTVAICFLLVRFGNALILGLVIHRKVVVDVAQKLRQTDNVIPSKLLPANAQVLLLALFLLDAASLGFLMQVFRFFAGTRTSLPAPSSFAQLCCCVGIKCSGNYLSVRGSKACVFARTNPWEVCQDDSCNALGRAYTEKNLQHQRLWKSLCDYGGLHSLLGFWPGLPSPLLMEILLSSKFAS